VERWIGRFIAAPNLPQIRIENGFVFRFGYQSLSRIEILTLMAHFEDIVSAITWAF